MAEFQEEKPPIRCPLCGKHPVHEEEVEHEGGIGGSYIDGYIIRCRKCDLTLCGKDQNDARRKWNQRAPWKVVVRKKD